MVVDAAACRQTAKHDVRPDHRPVDHALPKEARLVTASERSLRVLLTSSASSSVSSATSSRSSKGIDFLGAARTSQKRSGCCIGGEVDVVVQATEGALPRGELAASADPRRSSSSWRSPTRRSSTTRSTRTLPTSSSCRHRRGASRSLGKGRPGPMQTTSAPTMPRTRHYRSSRPREGRAKRSSP